MTPRPPTILFRDSAGRELTLEDLQGATGSVSWEIRMGAAVPEAAKTLHERGRAHGSRAEYDSALSLFAEAATLAPEWPYPIYDAAFTYLRKHDWPNAREWFERTLMMSPRGFFTAISAVDSLRREATGEFPPGTYLFYTHIEWLEGKAEKAELAKHILEHVPGFAPAWKELALTIEDDKERLATLERGLKAQPDPDTRGVLLINKAIVLARADRAVAMNILGPLALDPMSTIGTELGAKSVIALLMKSAR